MPEKKRQHYVPQFYLRRFSVSNGGKAIGIFNLRSDQFVKSGPLKNQAYKPYFYGHDLESERALSDVESAAAPVINQILSTHQLPRPASQQHCSLLVFTLFQHARTPYASREQDELLDKMIKTAFAGDPRADNLLDGANIRSVDPIPRTLRTMAQNYFLAQDLVYKLLLNSTSMPFISSDNPVVLYNQFLETRNHHGGITGLACKGLQIFLPISPTAVIVFFDKEVYKIGCRSHSIITLSNTRDVFSLNQLQVLNSLENVYFNGDITETQLRSLIKSARTYRRKSKANVDEYTSIGNQEESHSLLHAYKTDIKCNLALPVIGLTTKAKRYVMENLAVPVRNKELLSLHEQFTGAVSAGKCKIHDFETFLRDSGVMIHRTGA